MVTPHFFETESYTFLLQVNKCVKTTHNLCHTTYKKDCKEKKVQK